MKKCKTFSIISFILLLAATALLSFFVVRSQMVPIRLTVICLAGFLIFILLLSLLVFGGKRKFVTITGGVLSLLFSVLMIAAGLYLLRAVSAVQNISGGTKIEVASVGVYMLADETNDSTELTADMTYGILELQDRSNTDEAVKKLEAQLGSKLNVRTFAGPTELLNALFDHEVDAVIINSALLDLASEMPGYEQAADRLRSVSKIHIEKEVPVKEPETKRNPNRGGVDDTQGKTHAKQPFAVYISGIDNRGDLIEKSRSDVNIIAVVNPETHQILLLTTPRDYYVPLKFPEYTTSRDKLTHAGIYGVQVSMDTLGLLYDLDFDYYFRVNFGGFVDIVEAMGGVTVDVEKEFSTTEYTFPAGPNELNGYKALSFVRNRFGIGDQQRGRNQMAFIKGVINKAVSTDMLLNFNSILSSVEGSFETSMPYDVISALVRDQLETGASWNVVMYAATGTGNSAIPYSMNIEVYVMDPDEDSVQTAKDLIQQVYNGQILTAP